MTTKFWAASLAFALAACSGGPGDQGQAEENNISSANTIETESLPGNEEAAAQIATNGPQYVELASASDLFEIESARLALEKAQRAEVKELARMILADHERSTRELADAARQAQPPIAPARQLNPEQQAKIAALRQANGAGFDQLYLDQQVEAHEKALTLVSGFSQGVDLLALRRHAAEFAAPIQQHLSRARELQADR